MKKIISLSFVLLLFASSVFAAKLVEPATVTEKFYIRDASVIEKAVMAAGLKRKWQATKVSDNQIEAVLSSSRYSLTVLISYSNEGYSIAYKDSVGLKYDSKRNLIHSSYSRWIDNLIKDINANINQMRN